MLALGDSGPVPLLMAVQQGEVAPPCAEVNRHHGCLEHSPTHLLHSSSCKEATSSSLYAHSCRRLEPCGQPQPVLLMLRCCLDLQQPLLNLLERGLHLCEISPYVGPQVPHRWSW
ncbi:Zinc finger CCCH domain-containing protein 58 [Zea mays]|uniref:Zinc finger CCCH domain-containing protein 58 n=1 Tax=Zea mays TaxID=4577 RepID=A0A1D6FBY9_MAIZE|nr:Zinc finger CCCH domain-containing protein 58 [Zea mays]